MKVSLGEFASKVLEESFGSDSAIALELALASYSSALVAGRDVLCAPRFLSAGGERELAVFDVPVPAEVERTLRFEARRRGIPLDVVLLHALFLYCVESSLPAGRTG